MSYKAPWVKDAAPRTLEQTGMYEASANLLWLNPFMEGDTAQLIAGDVPQWRTVLEAVDKFMTLEAGIESSLASPQGTGITRLLFPITVPAYCDCADDGDATGVLGKFRVVAGHIYVWAWYLGMYRALQARDIACVAALWQMASSQSSAPVSAFASSQSSLPARNHVSCRKMTRLLVSSPVARCCSSVRSCF